MTYRPLLIPMVFVGTILLLFTAVAMGGNLKKKVFEGINNSGSVRDRCLKDQIPVTIKKLDENLYFVDVRNRYSGRIEAGSYGEARNIACSKKAQPILYYNKK